MPRLGIRRQGMSRASLNGLAGRSCSPRSIKAWDVLGPILPTVAEKTGLPPGLPVLAGVHDSNASLVPYLLSLPAPFTVVSTGTWVVIIGVGLPIDRITARNGMQANVDVLGRPGPVARFMGGREFAVMTDGHQQTADAEDLAAVLASGALALPSFVPDASPIRQQGRIEGAAARPSWRACGARDALCGAVHGPPAGPARGEPGSCHRGRTVCRQRRVVRDPRRPPGAAAGARRHRHGGRGLRRGSPRRLA